MKKKILFLTTFSSLFLAHVQTASAACEIGPIMFRDTLYGAALGTGVGALVLLANSSSTNIAPTLATSALVGGGIGVVVGVVEIYFSSCPTGGHKNREEVDAYRLNLKPMFTVLNNTNYSPAFIQSAKNDFNFNQVVAGISLVYPLN